MSSKFEGTGAIVRPLEERIKACRQADGKSITELAELIGTSRPVLSKILSGKQDGNPELLKRLEEYAEQVEERNPGLYKKERTQFPQRGFIQTRDANNVIGVCSAAQETSGLGVVVGKSGYGKTYALKYYAAMPRVAYVECDAAMGVRDFLTCVEEALGVTGTSSPKIWPRLQAMQRYFAVNTGWLLIVDEADKLISAQADRKLEALRALYDQSSLAVVISGEPRLKGTIENYSDRFANRVDYYALLQGLREEEVRDILKDHQIEEEAMEILIDRATNKKNGCYRLFDRTMDNIGRLMRHKEEEVITADILREASSLMML